MNHGWRRRLDETEADGRRDAAGATMADDGRTAAIEAVGISDCLGRCRRPIGRLIPSPAEPRHHRHQHTSNNKKRRRRRSQNETFIFLSSIFFLLLHSYFLFVMGGGGLFRLQRRRMRRKRRRWGREEVVSPFCIDRLLNLRVCQAPLCICST